jgi:large subunit ribosomal protein L7/L12
MALSKDEIVEAIKSMSVLELSELSKELQEVFGVSAAAPMMMAGGAAGGAAPAAAAGPAEDEAPTSFDVVMTSFGEKKINVIKVVREITGLGLKEAKDVVEGVPSKVKEGVNQEDAKALVAKLEAEGATVQIKPAGLASPLPGAYVAPGSSSYGSRRRAAGYWAAWRIRGPGLPNPPEATP